MSVAVEKPRRFRWIPAVILLAVGVGIQLYLWLGTNSDSWDPTERWMWFWYTAPATVFVWLLFWMFRSGLAWKTRFLGLAVFLAAVGGFFSFYTIVSDGAVGLRIVSRADYNAQEEAIEQGRQERFVNTKKTDNPGRGKSPAAKKFQNTFGKSEWVRFRGPEQNGILPRSELDLIVPVWERKKKQPELKRLWKIAVGEGWSSFTLKDGRLYTQEQYVPEGETGDQYITCTNAATGEPLWQYRQSAAIQTSMGGNGPRGTPTLADGKLYAICGHGTLTCLDAEKGEKIWERNILEDSGAENIDWGMAGSPLVYGDVVIANPGAQKSGKSRAVIAYDKHDGKIIWAAGDRPSSYCAPRVETIAGVETLLIFHGDGIAGHDPESGEEWWFYGMENQFKINVAQPIVREERYVFVSSGYNIGAALLDVSQSDGKWQVKEVWRTPDRFELKFNGAVEKDGFIYGLDNGRIACVDFKTGKRKWKGKSYGYGQMLLLGDVLLIAHEKRGTVHFVKASPEGFEELASFRGLRTIGTLMWNHPIVAGGRLFLRNEKEAACFDLRKSTSTD